jgi:hypothetical protein
LEALLSDARRLAGPITPGERQAAALGETKFIECVPPALQAAIAVARMSPSAEAVAAGERPIRVRRQE